jgi:hypothetical protein
MEAVLKKASFVDTLKAVLWGLAGIRRKAEHERAPLNPVHVVIGAVLLGVLFVLTLVAIVRIVTA